MLGGIKDGGWFGLNLAGDVLNRFGKIRDLIGNDFWQAEESNCANCYYSDNRKGDQAPKAHGYSFVVLGHELSLTLLAKDALELRLVANTGVWVNQTERKTKVFDRRT